MDKIKKCDGTTQIYTDFAQISPSCSLVCSLVGGIEFEMKNTFDDDIWTPWTMLNTENYIYIYIYDVFKESCPQWFTETKCGHRWSFSNPRWPNSFRSYEDDVSLMTHGFSNNARKAFKITKDIYTKLQKMYPNVFKGELMCSFKRNKNLGDYLVSAKLK